ncbi:MAG: MarR family transcriptional regulator [Raoultibacter sp.]
MSKHAPDCTTLDSAYFVAFEMLHGVLKVGLTTASTLNITQYRTLVKLLGLGPDSIRQNALGSLLKLPANSVTQVVDTLEAAGFVRRQVGTNDGRQRFVGITQQGVAHVGVVNEAIVAQLYATFPTHNETYRHILEASIVAGAAIDPAVSPLIQQRYPASRTLVSFELFKQVIEHDLRQATGASYNECRLLQRLDEAAAPLRAVDLSAQLMLGAVTITRATSRLEARGWVQRLSSPHDRKAVFVACTNAGRKEAAVIATRIRAIAQEYLWSKLSPEHCRAITQVGSVVMADMQAKKEAERVEALDHLKAMAPKK